MLYAPAPNFVLSRVFSFDESTFPPGMAWVGAILETLAADRRVPAPKISSVVVSGTDIVALLPA